MTLVKQVISDYIIQIHSLEIAMATEAAIETISARALKEELTRIVLERLRGASAPANANPSTETGAAVVTALGEALDQYLGKGGHMFLVRGAADLSPVIAKVMAQTPHAVQARRQAFTEAHLDALVDLYLTNDPLAVPLAEIERDNAEAQARFIDDVKCYSAEEIARLAGHVASNRSATATRWKTQRAIFGVRRLGRDRYPAFQFQDGRPRKIVGKVLEALPRDMSPWQTALWFSSSNGWLDGDKPMERLADAASLLAAAAHEGDDWIG